MKIDNFEFKDLLPTSVKDDPKFQAAAKSLDNIFIQTNERVKNLLIYSRIDEIDEDTLDKLAWQFGIDYYEGYGQVQTLDEKRMLAKIAITQKWYKGTRFSIERIPEILGYPIEIIEWWQESLIEDMQPYEFDVFIDTSLITVNPKFYTDVWQLIDRLKNVRSHLRKIQAMIAIREKLYMGVISGGFETGIVLPKLTGAVSGVSLIYLHGGFYGYISGDVFPLFLEPTEQEEVAELPNNIIEHWRGDREYQVGDKVLYGGNFWIAVPCPDDGFLWKRYFPQET
jgi:phage tail P2-like protein